MFRLFFIITALINLILQVKATHFGNEYNFVQTVLIHDGNINSVGYEIKGLLKLEKLNGELYLINLEKPKLYIYSKKQRKTYEFVPHVSNIDYYNNDPFLLEVFKGTVKNVYISKEDNKGMINIKKAISNLFQFQTSNNEGEENDLSGTCKVTYNLKGPNHVMKTKHGCTFSNSFTSNSVWGGTLFSQRSSDIFLNGDIVQKIISLEEFVLASNLGDRMASNVSSKIEIKLIGSEILKEKFPSKNVKEILAKIEAEKKSSLQFETFDLVPEQIELSCINCPRFSKVIGENNDSFDEKYLGTIKSTSAFLKAIQAVRRSSAQDIYNTINSKKNRKILPQLMDILGAVQTINTHEAAVKLLKINTSKYDLDLCERYFWALSMAPTVQPHILSELQKLLKNKYEDKKLWQTIILTFSALVNKYSIQKEETNELVTETIEFLSSSLKNCGDSEQCQHMYIKALSNIPHVKAIPILLEIIENSNKKAAAMSMKILSKMDSKCLNEKVLKIVEKILLSSAVCDSSTRIFALEVLLNSKPSYVQLSRTLSILKQKEKSRELKEYLLQRLVQLSEMDNSFKKMMKTIFVENGYYDYDALSQGGLSTSFSRSFMPSGLLTTSQEIVGGILKQGSVDINLMYSGKLETPFKLGIFAGGLSSFVSSTDSSEDDDDDDEVTTAGLELSVLGVELRPFVFFNGTGELMGHVWSGTASSLIPAYQALLLLEESTNFIPLANAETLNIRLESAASIDLSGQIEISLWNRNAKSLVKNRAGLIINSTIILQTPFIDVDISLDLSVEPELHLTGDLDFVKGASLCLQLQQPKTLVKYSSHKSQALRDTKQILRKNRQIIILEPARTYSLNAKNNEMCSKLFT